MPRRNPSAPRRKPQRKARDRRASEQQRRLYGAGGVGDWLFGGADRRTIRWRSAGQRRAAKTLIWIILVGPIVCLLCVLMADAL
jgi:hypothetical protein